MTSAFHAIRELLPVRDPVLVFALTMCVILLAPMLARRVRLPEIIGLILAGLLIGEHGLNILARDATMILLGTVGLLYIMFLAGLEVDLLQFLQQKLKSAVFGFFTFLIPMALGTFMAIGVLAFSWPAGLLLASMFASHTLLAYPIINRLGIARNPAVLATLGGTIITDTLALLVLAVIVALTTGSLTVWFGLRIGFSILLFMLLVFAGIPISARYYFHKYSDYGGRDFVFVLTVCYLTSFFARLAGLEPIIGAFLAGLALNSSIPAHSPLMQRIQFTGQALFVPFFLISVGMLVDVRLLFSRWHVWLVGGIMVITVIVAKWLAAAVSRRLLGFSKDEGRIMFGLSVTQAAATLAAVFVGYRIGLFDDEVLNGAVMMILVTCVIGPYMVETYGRRVALQEETMPLRSGESPLRILIPLANPSSAPALMDLAFLIRRPHSQEPIYPLTIAYPDGDVAKQVAAGERMLGQAVIYAAGAGVPVQPVTRVDMNIANGIIRAIAELRISTVVIGWTRSPSRRTHALGKVLDKLLKETRETMVVCRLKHPINITRRIVMVVPPRLNREIGFGEVVRTVKLMTHQLSARLHVIMDESEAQTLEPQIKSIRPVLSTVMHSVSFDAVGQGDLPLAPAGPDDMLVLLNARFGRPAWTEELSDLPRQLAETYPNHNFAVFYPSELSEDIGEASVSDQMLQPQRTVLGLPAMTCPEVFAQMIAHDFSDVDELKSTVDRLVQNTREYSTEIAPGAVLVHAQVDLLEEPRLYLATCPSGLDVPQADEPVKVVLVMLSPTYWPATDHFRSLTGLAGMMRGEGLADQLASATTFDEMKSLIVRTEA